MDARTEFKVLEPSPKGGWKLVMHIAVSQGEGKGVTRTDVNKLELPAKALVVGEPIVECGRIWQNLAGNAPQRRYRG